MASHVTKFMSTGLLALILLTSCSSNGSQDSAHSSEASTQTAQSSAPTSLQSSEPSDTQSASPSTPSSSTPDTPQATPTPSDEPAQHGQAEELVEELTLKQQAASLVMAGVTATGATSSELAAMKKQGISNIFLRGRSQLSVKQTAARVEQITDTLESNIPEGLPVWVATDQEGGFVRVLQGSGFTALPTAVKQGRWSNAKLSTQLGQVAEELRAAGVNVNLAPVADVVPAALGTGNAPIGYFGRQYANNAADVSRAITTASSAMAEHGVQPVVKHFPGLGQVANNTDTNRGVTDTHITADSSDLEPFAAAIKQGSSWVMISNARYAKLDAAKDAPFSSKIITDLLREQMGYEGLVISDDLCEARQVDYLSVGERAVEFVAAGGTLPLCVNSSSAVVMAKALANQAGKDEAFAAQVKQAATLVLKEKLESEAGR